MHEADLNHSSETLKEKLRRIYALRRTTTKVNWDQAGYRELLRAFGNPHLSLPLVIHVAGTNGKGSVIAFLRAMLEAQGLRVHSYTSPHLMAVNERIVLAGQEIDDARLEALIDQALAFNDGAPLSFFEIMTAAAFRAFSDVPADVLLLEVGMGGRLDCTNVIDVPLVSIINRISMDHTEFLGSDLPSITREKAGIMKRGVPCIVGYQGEGARADEIMGVLCDEAECIGAELLVCGEDWNVRSGDGLIFEYQGQEHLYPLPNLFGEHQNYNAGVALAAIEAIGDYLSVSDDAKASGLRNVQWRGRMQALNILDGYDVWLDCGHNDSAGEAIAAQLSQWQSDDDRPIYLVLGMLKTKNFEAFLRPILPYVSGCVLVPVAGNAGQSLSGERVAELIEELDVEGAWFQSCDDVVGAFESLKGLSKNARILVAGSVYLAGDVLQMMNNSA